MKSSAETKENAAGCGLVLLAIGLIFIVFGVADLYGWEIGRIALGIALACFGVLFIVAACVSD